MAGNKPGCCTRNIRIKPNIRRPAFKTNTRKPKPAIRYRPQVQPKRKSNNGS